MSTSAAEPRGTAPRTAGAPAAPAALTRPRTSCIVDHYDYGRYALAALRSALEQTTAFDEIVFVDDGSTDGSTETLRRVCARHDNVIFVAKPNGGQLSCFNAGFARTSGDVVFFLDADDEYEPDHVERTLAHLARDPRCDVAISAHRLFGDADGVVRMHPTDRDLGFSAVLALSRSQKRIWVSPTSTLAFRRWVLERLLPLPLESDWRLRADDCLTFGSSLAGARKAFLAEPTVRYRVHASNGFYGKPLDRDRSYRHRLAVQRLFRHFETSLGLGHDFAALAPKELATHARPSAELLSSYAKIVLRSDLRARRACGALTSLLHVYARKRLARTSEPGAVPS